MGSPRDLLLSNDVSSLTKKLTEIPNCRLDFRLFSNRKLLRAQRLISENEAVGRHDIIAGMVPKEVTLAEGTRSKFLACIGDEEVIDAHNNVSIIPTKPNIASPVSLKVSKCDVLIPDRENVEKRLVNSVTKSVPAIGINAPQVLSRTLKIGLHNGHTVLGGEYQAYALQVDGDDEDILLVSEDAIDVHGYVPHELMSLVCVIEYEIGMPIPSLHAKDMLNSISMIRDGQIVTTVVLGTTLYVPSDGKILFLKNSKPAANGDAPGVELTVRTDESCSIFSPKPVFIDVEKEKKRQREAKQRDTDRKYSETVDETDDTFSITFSLSAIDPARGEIEHGQDVLVEEMDATTLLKRSTRFAEDDEDTDFVATRDRERDRERDRDRERRVADSRASSSPLRVSTRRGFGKISSGTATLLRHQRDEDTYSVADSLVEGDSDASSLRLDPQYYASNRGPPSDAGSFGEVANDAPRFYGPRDKHSLMARTMQAPLVARDKLRRDAHLQPSDILDDVSRAQYPYTNRAGPQHLGGNFGQVRELTRGARTRLNRHGFEGAMHEGTTSFAAAPKIAAQMAHGGIVARHSNVDVDLEARDPLSLHDVSIQFAGYRTVPAEMGKAITAPRPRSVYFSYQFYTCQPTRTELLRLLPADEGQLCVLARDDAHARDEPPLSLRYVIDCSRISPTEGEEFAEYLAHKMLFVDVWDADSLMMLGTCAIPLRRIMRQGTPAAKCAIECDVVNSEMDAQTHGGITSSTISNGGAISGRIVGSVHIIMCNHGQPGQGSALSMRAGSKSDPSSSRVRAPKPDQSMVELNWRIHGATRSTDMPLRKGAGRPRNSVRAKPLSENAPELSHVLEEYRHSTDGKGSMRSLTAHRGGEGVHTLTYDEVVTLFKRFQGTIKSTVQYCGSLMSLLDVPSWNVALRKLIKAYQVESEELFEKEMLNFADAKGYLTANDLGEFFRALFEKLNIKYRIEEVALLSQKFCTVSAEGTANPHEILTYCRDEALRQEWVLVGKRFRRKVHDAYLVGIDAEQILAEKDTDGDHYISVKDFKEAMQNLSRQSKLAPKDIALAAKHFSRRPAGGESLLRDPISLKEVMAFLGKHYVGNLEVRLANVLRPQEDLLDVIARHDSKKRGSLTYEEMESALSDLGAYKILSQEQVRNIIVKVDVDRQGVITASQLLHRLGLGSAAADISVEALLRLLLERVQQHGDVIEAFRHFDTDGDASISKTDLEEGLQRLGIFDNIPNWRSQVPAIVAKFDKSKDGCVSLKEFFANLGVTDYAPNIIQSMTKIFEESVQEGHTIKEIFMELDEDKTGFLGATELIQGLKKLGTFGEVSQKDANAVVAAICGSSKQDDASHEPQKCSLDRFVGYFSSRVNQATVEKQHKHSNKIIVRFREIMKTVSAKAKASDIFNLFDKDHSGTITTDELKAGLRKQKHFEQLTDGDLHALVHAMTSSEKQNEVTLKQFVDFVEEDTAVHVSSVHHHAPTTVSSKREALAINVRNIFRKATAKGMSIDDLFRHVDADKDGEVTNLEMRQVLTKLPAFKDVSLADVDELIATLDRNGNGKISLQEFKRFVTSDSLPNLDSSKVAETTARELFVRHSRRIGEPDGGIEGLLAYLDDDEDGLIAYSAFLRILKREDIFTNKALTESDLETMIDPMTRDGNISVVSLLKFVNGEDEDDKLEERQDKDDDLQKAVEYEFSRDPEIHALEKKMRGLGRTLAKKGVNVEGLFRTYDALDTGMIRRTEFIEVLSKMGLYILEQGRVLDEASKGTEGEMRRQQVHQVQMLKGARGGYAENAPRAARRLVMAAEGGAKEGDFKEHLESMALVNWYRQSQKKVLLQKVLSHSLAATLRIYPRFGKTLFFEHPITNPFSHEERFILDVNDPELRLVTSFDEWLHLRHTCSPCVGELGSEPVEAEMFDRDGYGNVQIALLPHETLALPFTFMTLVPHKPLMKKPLRRAHSRSTDYGGDFKGGGRSGMEQKSGGYGESKTQEPDMPAADPEDEEPFRTVEVRVISGTHGHVVSVLRLLVCPRAFVVHRTLRFFEPENSIMKRRIQLVDYGVGSLFPEESTAASKFVHCVESDSDGNAMPGQSNVVIEWGPSTSTTGAALDMLLRYRCGSFPNTGSFYLIIFNDAFQSQQHEVWSIIVNSRQRLDVHGPVGSSCGLELVVRGDRFARRARAYVSFSQDRVGFEPDVPFQLVPGAFARVGLKFSPRSLGTRRLQLNLVDVDSKELISAWLLTASATAPAVMRTYDVDALVGRAIHKKIIFKNPWDVPRRFTLSSSDETIMRPRVVLLEVAAYGTRSIYTPNTNFLYESIRTQAHFSTIENIHLTYRLCVSPFVVRWLQSRPGNSRGFPFPQRSRGSK